MVFAGQDKWRKHPLIYQCYKRPFVGLGTATAIFSAYLVLNWAVESAEGNVIILNILLFVAVILLFILCVVHYYYSDQCRAIICICLGCHFEILE